MGRYSLFYKKAWRANGNWPDFKWDVFLSAFNSSDRVRMAFTKAPAKTKHWFISPEYRYSSSELPTDAQCFISNEEDEAANVRAYFDKAAIDFGKTRLCIDTTGFMRPHLLAILKFLTHHGVKRFDALYSEPEQYVKKENTKFSDEVVVEVRQVGGFEGTHIPDTSNDVLIIGSGYDHVLISHVAEYKESARKVQLLGLPSLRADMYQENVLRAQRASEQIGTSDIGVNTFFAPANDPFVTAEVLHEVYTYASRIKPVTNLYLC